MKNFLVLCFLLFSVSAFAGADRIIEAKYITNGAATLTIPTSSAALVPDTRTVNGHALSADVTVTKSDVGLGNVNDAAQVEKADYSAKGVLLGGTGAGTYSALPAGTDDYVLTYDSAEANGLKWAAIPTVAPALSGSVASPTLITAAGGVIFSGSAYTNVYFIEGDGGAIDITADPQISAGNAVGQRLTLISQDAANTVTLEHGTGLDLNGAWVGGANSSIELMWDGSTWIELSRK